jgi:hypothetical protein
MCIELHFSPDPTTLAPPLTHIISMPSRYPCYWLTSCILPYTCRMAAKGWRLTTLFGSTTAVPMTAPKKKGSLLPLLTVVFLASYGLMTLLIVEQGATIQSQRNLIQMLQADSTQFWALKGKAMHEQQMATQTPSTQGQTPSTQTPSTQAVPQHHSQHPAGKSAKPQTQVPPMPASDLGDQRRELITL